MIIIIIIKKKGGIGKPNWMPTKLIHKFYRRANANTYTHTHNNTQNNNNTNNTWRNGKFTEPPTESKRVKNY